MAAGSEIMIAILKSENRKAKQVWLKIEDVNNDVNTETIVFLSNFLEQLLL